MPWAGGSAVIPTAEKWQTKGGGFYSTFSGEGTLSSDLDYIKRILSYFSGTGSLSTELVPTPGTFLLDFARGNLGAAVDYTNASARLVLDSDVPAGATKSLKWLDSRTISDSVFFTLPITVAAGGGTISFQRKVSSEFNYDGLRFYVNGVQQTFISGEQPWAEYSVPVTAGAKTLMWAFTHDSSAWDGSNAAWLANIQVTNTVLRPATATGNGKRPEVWTFEDGAIPPVISTTSWTNASAGSRFMSSPDLAVDTVGDYDLVIDTSYLTQPGIIGFDLSWIASGGDYVSLYSGTTMVWSNQSNGENTGFRRFDLVVAPTTDTVTVRYTKGAGTTGQWVRLDNLSFSDRLDPATLSSSFSGEGTLSTKYGASGPDFLDFGFSGEGTLTSAFSGRKIKSNFSGEGVLFTELGYTVLPAELGTAPLGKLVNYTIGTSATPLNPAEGSGSTPTVSGTYVKGLHPETALGERGELKFGNIGTYEGEIVNLSMDRASDNVRVSMSTPLTLLNTEMTLFPFIDAAESTWTAVRAIDYWTQQCGLFYDKVPGEVIAYASAYGHENSYAAGTTTHFYERLTGGTTATTVVNERSVKTFGSNVVSTTAFHEDADASIPLTLLNHQKLLFSVGLGIRGTGRTATVRWNFLDSWDHTHVLQISATSAGLITATVNGVVVDSTTVAGDANYRVTASLETLGSTKLGKLTVHTDDLAGNGLEAYMGKARVLSAPFPSGLRVTSITHSSSGGSGSVMLRWGTFLSIDKTHTVGVPPVQKVLSQSKKPRLFVSGFEGNVWNMLNEFCSIARLDVRFLGESLSVGPRNTSLAAPGGNFSEFQYSSERRDKYKQVAIINLQSKADMSGTALLWRADSVYQVAAREIFETTVQTEHSILSVVQPQPVSGIWPFPYKQGGGQYVVTGADGYIVSPQWWIDNGGKVEVSLTGKAGELAIKIIAPDLDTVRAPYRISEGEADRPALYISGSGILNKPKEVHVGTGARNAKEGFDQVFDSPFMAGVVETYDTAMAMASEYSAHNAEVDFEIPNSFDTPSRFGQFPAGNIFTDNVRNYRIDNVSQTHSKVSGTAVTHTTIGAYVDSFPEGATLADARVRHFGKTIRQFNITPLRGTSV